MEELDLKSIYTILCRKKFLVFGIVLISIVLGMIYSYCAVVPKYESSTTIILGNYSLDGIYLSNMVQTEISKSSNLVSTYSELIKSKSALKEVKENLKLDIDEDILKEMVKVEIVPETEVIEITVTSESSSEACKITNEVTKVFSEKIKEINNAQTVYIVDRAEESNIPYNVNHLRDICVFALIGFAISIIILIMIIIIDTTIKSVDDIENEIGLKNLSVVPVKRQEIIGNNKKSDLIIYEEGKKVLTDTFNNLRTNIQFSNINNKENKILLVTSCFSSEGKSYISANLAIAFANAGKKVILIDADMVRGKQAKLFNIPNELGFSNYLSNLDKNGMEINERVNKYIKETEVKNLNVITSGNVPPNPAELLTSNRLQELMKELSVFYDLIIIDGAPVLPTAESLILTRIANSTLLVTLFNKTKKDEVLKAKKDIQNIGGRIIGTVINRVPITDLEYINEKNVDSLKNRFFKKNEIRRQIRKEKREKIKNDFKGLNFDREKKEKFVNKINISKCKISNLKLKIKEFFNSRSKKEETKLLDMSKDEKVEYIRNQKRERQNQIKKEKQAQKELRKQERLEKEKEKELAKLEKTENIEKEENVEEQLEIKEINTIVENKVKEEKNADFTSLEKEIINTGKFIEDTLKSKAEKTLDEQLEKIDTEIKTSDEIIHNTENELNETISGSENGKFNFDFEKVKIGVKEGFDKFKNTLKNGKEEFTDLKNKLSQEYAAKREEDSKKRAEMKAAKDAYNSRKAEDKAEKDALRKEEIEKYRQIKEEERAKQEVIRQEEKRLKEAERELKRKAKELERQELAQKRMAQKGLREAEKENRRNKKEALKMKQKEEARIKEEILEDNLYPKTKYNKDI